MESSSKARVRLFRIAALIGCAVILYWVLRSAAAKGAFGGKPREMTGTGVDLSGGVTVSYEDTHDGFHGDGYTLVEYSYKTDDVENNISEAIAEGTTDGDSGEQPVPVCHWKKLPLSSNLHEFIYESFNDSYDDGTVIPEVQNGYYYFYDRHAEAKDPYDDSELFNRYSFNFTVAIYDSDRDTLYWLDYDT